MKLSFAIQAVPQRRGHVESMLTRLPSAAVHWDVNHEGCWPSWRAAWRLRDAESTHHVVLQDDVLLCPDFSHVMEALACARPHEMISGFLPRASTQRAVASGRHWVQTRRFLWAQCVMLPVSLGDEIIRWVGANEETQGKAWAHHDDVRIAAFLAAHRMAAYVPVPHPVEHIGDALPGGSVLKHNFQAAKRRSRPGVWLGENTQLGHINWADLTHIRE